MVTWRDAFFDFEEKPDDEPRADYLVRTLGFYVRENEKFLTLAQEELPAGDGFRAVTHIPVAVIERRDAVVLRGAVVLPGGGLKQ